MSFVDTMKIYDLLPVWGQNIACTLEGFRVRNNKYGERQKKYLESFMSRSTWTYEQKCEYRDQQLQKMIEHCYLHVPYYRKLFDSLGIDYHSIRRLEDLQQLPILTKQIVLDAAKNLPDVQFDIYGSVMEKYKEAFFKCVEKLPNVSYCGIYKEKGDQLYRMLNTYDIMLFPTRWAFEGVPGTLIETKIAGLASIVSDICYNAELVADGKEGIVLSENNAAQLAQAIRRLDLDRQYLLSLKQGSKASAERYYIENYIDEITEELSQAN